MSNYANGQTVTLSATFKNRTKSLTDPTTVTLQVTDPAGTAVLYTYAEDELVRESVGVYYKDHQFTSAGSWSYKWIATGTVQQQTGNINIKIT